MLSFLYVYSHHSILECYNLFSGVELSMRSFFVISRCHSYSSQPQCGFTAGERQAWTNYENNGNEYLVVGDIVHFEYSDIQGSVFLI